MAISNEDIYQKLEKMHLLLKLVQKEEGQIVQEEFKVEIEEEKLMEILGNEANKKFNNILDWKNYVWENCEFKKTTMKQNRIDFICNKTGKSCRFVDCFKNKIE